MTERQNNTDALFAEDLDMQRIFDNLPKRPEPSMARMQAARAELEQEWRTMLAGRRRMLRFTRMAIAASLFTTVSLLAWFLLPFDAPVQMQLVRGEIRIDGERFTGSRATPASVHAGDFEVLSDVRLLGDGVSFALASGARGTWRSPTVLELAQGQVYVDSEERPGSPDHSVQIHTPLGVVTDIGTQFTVELADATLTAAVRKGEILYNGAAGTHSVKAQPTQTGLVRVEGRDASVSAEALSSERWSWVDHVSRTYDEQRVIVLLTQIAADLGKRLEFATPGVEAVVTPVRLDGMLNGHSPHAALDELGRTVEIVWQETPEALLIDLPR